MPKKESENKFLTSIKGYNSVLIYQNLPISNPIHSFTISTLIPTSSLKKINASSPKVSSDRLEKPGIEPATPVLHGKWSNHYTIVTPIFVGLLNREPVLIQTANEADSRGLFCFEVWLTINHSYIVTTGECV